MTERAVRCLECGEPIPKGRRDKIFCGEKCKNRYHYHYSSKSRARNEKLRVLNALDRNYRILEILIDNGVATVELGVLVLRGFNPYYVTAYKKHRPHDEYWCFDIKYCMSERKVYKISRASVLRPELSSRDP